MESAEKQVAMNDVNHKDIFDRIAALPTTVVKLRSTITEADIRYNLINQLNMLDSPLYRSYQLNLKWPFQLQLWRLKNP